MSDDRQYTPATLRNRDFILDVLRDALPMTGVILEIASGSGEHIVHFARNFRLSCLGSSIHGNASKLKRVRILHGRLSMKGLN